MIMRGECHVGTGGCHKNKTTKFPHLTSDYFCMFYGICVCSMLHSCVFIWMQYSKIKFKVKLMVQKGSKFAAILSLAKLHCTAAKQMVQPCWLFAVHFKVGEGGLFRVGTSSQLASLYMLANMTFHDPIIRTMWTAYNMYKVKKQRKIIFNHQRSVQGRQRMVRVIYTISLLTFITKRTNLGTSEVVNGQSFCAVNNII